MYSYTKQLTTRNQDKLLHKILKQINKQLGISEKGIFKYNMYLMRTLRSNNAKVTPNLQSEG